MFESHRGINLTTNIYDEHKQICLCQLSRTSAKNEKLSTFIKNY